MSASTSAAAPVLSIRDLVTEFSTPTGPVRAVDGLTLDVRPGEILGVVGESGSGKSISMLSVLGLVPKPGRVVAGEVLLDGRDLLAESPERLREVRGSDIAMIFQDPMTSMNPVFTIGDQIAEAVLAHHPDRGREGAWARAVELLGLVGVPSPDERADQYPHEFSGGMRQRAMIAMAMANRPRVLIADEPTTALDVTIQAQVLDVLTTAQSETDAAMVLITHDLGLIAEVADRVVVMYAGRIIESADVVDIFHAPRHPYTIGLMGSLPKLEGDREPLQAIPCLLYTSPSPRDS